MPKAELKGNDLFLWRKSFEGSQILSCGNHLMQVYNEKEQVGKKRNTNVQFEKEKVNREI